MMCCPFGRVLWITLDGFDNSVCNVVVIMSFKNTISNVDGRCGVHTNYGFASKFRN